jgi:hypothetical protein
MDEMRGMLQVELVEGSLALFSPSFFVATTGAAVE